MKFEVLPRAFCRAGDHQAGEMENRMVEEMICRNDNAMFPRFLLWETLYQVMISIPPLPVLKSLPHFRMGNDNT